MGSILRIWLWSEDIAVKVCLPGDAVESYLPRLYIVHPEFFTGRWPLDSNLFLILDGVSGELLREMSEYLRHFFGPNASPITIASGTSASGTSASGTSASGTSASGTSASGASASGASASGASASGAHEGNDACMKWIEDFVHNLRTDMVEMMRAELAKRHSMALEMVLLHRALEKESTDRGFSRWKDELARNRPFQV